MKVENIKVVNFDNAFRGMRNPKNSWKLSDSRILREPLPNEENYIERKIEWDSKFSIDNLYNKLHELTSKELSLEKIKF